jgi:hypothetical protein
MVDDQSPTTSPDPCISPPPQLASSPPSIIQIAAQQLMSAWNALRVSHHDANRVPPTPSTLIFLPFSVDGCDIVKRPGSHYSVQSISACQQHCTNGRDRWQTTAATLSTDLFDKLSTLTTGTALQPRDIYVFGPLPEIEVCGRDAWRMQLTCLVLIEHVG